MYTKYHSQKNLISFTLKSFSLNLLVFFVTSSNIVKRFLQKLHLYQQSVSCCMAHCLSLSLTTHVMISYSYGFLGLGDKFNCVCGQEGVLEEVKMVETEKCDQPCPVGGLQCGQPAKDLMRYVHIP